MKSVWCTCFLIVLVCGRKGFGPTEQEWGYVTVREGAHMFWWLHYTNADVDNPSERPLVIWLQGGPGRSSTGLGNFEEIGPLDPDLNPRNHTWVNDVNVLFVDSPVGVGFSYVDRNESLTTTNRQIAEDFLVFLQKFYERVPSMTNTSMYIFAQSYGGKMAVEIGLVIDEAINDGILDVRFAGICLGGPWISPVDSVLTWAPYLYNLGVIDQNGYQRIQEVAESVKEACDNELYTEATIGFGRMQRAVQLFAYDVDLYNVLKKMPSPKRDLKIMNNQVRNALNLSTKWVDVSWIVFDRLLEDFMRPVTQRVETLLNTTEVKVVVYNGQLDVIVNIVGTNKWMDNLRFNSLNQWENATRQPFLLNNVIEGYYKKSGNLAMYWVNRAGHMVPTDNPAAMSFILNDIIDKS